MPEKMGKVKMKKWFSTYAKFATIVISIKAGRAKHRNGGNMRYFFEAKVEKQDKGYEIHLPFNVWEVCKQRDVIQGDLVLDNKIIDC